MGIFALILMIAAVILLFLAAFGVGAVRVNLMALGLALWATAVTLGMLPLS